MDNRVPTTLPIQRLLFCSSRGTPSYSISATVSCSPARISGSPALVVSLVWRSSPCLPLHASGTLVRIFLIRRRFVTSKLLMPHHRDGISTWWLSRLLPPVRRSQCPPHRNIMGVLPNAIRHHIESHITSLCRHDLPISMLQ